MQEPNENSVYKKFLYTESELEENYHLYRFPSDKRDKSFKRNLHNLHWHAQSVII